MAEELTITCVLCGTGLTKDRIGRRNFQEETGKREWIFVMCDGLPYGIAHKLIYETYFCSKCHDSFVGFEGFKLHNLKVHDWT